MGYLLGTDEAGYGPNLGPLVISATVWEAPDKVRGEKLFDRLRHVVAPSLTALAAAAESLDRSPCLAMADSKQLYSSGKGLKHLERGVLAALGLLGQQPRTWRDVWCALAPDAGEILARTPWYTDFDLPLPVDCDGGELESLVETLAAGLATAGVRLVAMRSRVVFAEDFNGLIEMHGNKGETLSRATLALASQIIEPLSAGPISVICDKHGGRNMYADLLSEFFPEPLIEIHGESRERSTYRFGPDPRRIQFCFRTRAEACLPVALASMASKYLRELAMRAFNDFWTKRVPDLQPTAGYPTDAKRFRADIAIVQKRLKIEDRILWRVR